MLRYKLLMLPLLAALLACSSPKPTTPPVEEGPKITPKPDSGAVIELTTGTIEAAVQDALDVRAVAAHTDGAHTYVVVEIPQGKSQPTSVEHTHIKASVHGVALAERTGRFHKGPGFVVRFVGDPGDAFTLTTFEGARINGWGTMSAGTKRTFKVTGITSAPQQPELAGVFLDGLTNNIGHLEPAPLRSFISSRAAQLKRGQSTATSQPRPGFDRPRSQPDLSRTMNLYTGATSIDEALQTRRGLRLRTDKLEPTIAIETLKGPPLPSHPWPKMIQELGVTPNIEHLASYVPHDALYLHFKDLREFVRTSREVSTLITPVVRITESSGGASHFTARYERQLMLERTELSERLGHVAAKGVALVMSDPYLREGTDVSVLFHINNAMTLEGALATYAASARSKRPDLKESTYTLEGHTVQLFSTPDRDHHRHQVKVGDVLIVSNSRAAVRRIIEAHKGTRPSLQASGDFQYMRALYPANAKKETGFVFLGDALITRVISPKHKILASRRLRALADLRALNYAALMHGWLEGTLPKDTSALLASTFGNTADLAAFDGTPLAYTTKRGARSQRWGTAAFGTPLVELDLKTITKEEKQAYEVFQLGYQRNWSTFVDPIAVRLTRSDDGKRMELDGRMLPLIDGTGYNDIVRQVGLARIKTAATIGGMEWSFALGKEASLRRELNQLSQSFTRDRDINIDWVGGWVSVGTRDRSGIWDAFAAFDSLPSLESRSTRRQRAEDNGVSQWDLLARLPVYAAIEVSNGLGLAAMLSGARRYIETSAPGLVAWELGEAYREIPTTKVVENVGQTGRTGSKSPIAIHYATAKGVFVIALERETLEAKLDDILDGRIPVASGAPTTKVPSAKDETFQSSVAVRTWGPKSWMTKLALAMVETEAIEGAMNSAKLATTLQQTAGRYSDQLALDYLGVAAVEVHGQGYKPGAFGMMAHEIYGTPYSFTLPKRPVTNSPITSLVVSTELLDMALSFDGQGEHRGLHTRAVWTRR